MTNLDSILKSRDITLLTKIHIIWLTSPYSQSYGFSTNHLWVWELDRKEGWALKNWCFWTVVLENILESPLGFKEIKLINPKGKQPWIFIGRTDAEAEAPLLWPTDAKNWLIGKDPDARKDWGQEEKGVTENEIVGWHHWLNGNEFEQTQADSDGQEMLVCCSSSGCKELYMTWKKVKAEVSQPCPTLCNPMTYTVHGIL